MDFTPQNRGKWIVTLPSTNQINNTRIIHPIMNLIAPLPPTNRINNTHIIHPIMNLIAPLPSTNRINNTRIIHLILNLIAPLPSTNRINNRGEGKEQYKQLGIRNGMKQNTKWHKTKHEMECHKTRNGRKQNRKWHNKKSASVLLTRFLLSLCDVIS